MMNQGAGVLSPTVTKVLDEFVSAMREDDAIAADAIDRLQELLLKGAVPTADEIGGVVFRSSGTVTK